MAVFVVISEVHKPELRPAIEQAFPGKFFHWTPTVSFVRGAATAQSVAAALGIQMRDEQGGIKAGIQQTAVIETTPAYWGWASSALWSWLKSSFEAAD